MSDPELDAHPLPGETHPHPLAPETPHSLEIDIEPEPTTPTPTRAELLALRRRRTRQVGGLAVVVWVLAACVFALGLVRHGHRHQQHQAAIAKRTAPPPALPATRADPPPRPPDLVAAAAPDDEAPPTEKAPPPAAPTTPDPPTPNARRGQIVPPPSAAGHRIYVDGHIVGEGPKSVDVACGDHAVRVGSHGQSRSVHVPCGGVLTME